MAPAAPQDGQVDPGERQLSALREALDSRLAMLEEALADPSRGESLEALILDLSRLATEEARATAARAYLVAKIEADKEVAQAHAMAEFAEDEHRALVSELRHAAEQANERIANLEREKQAEHAGRVDLEAVAARERKAASELQQALTQVRQELEDERRSSAALAAQLASERKSSQALGSQLEAERASGREFQSKFDAERVSGDALRRALERAEERAASFERELGEAQKRAVRELAETQAALERERAKIQAAHDAAVVELERQRAALTGQLRIELDEERKAALQLRAELEALRESSDQLRRDAEQADQRLSSVLAGNVQTLAHQEQLKAQLAAALAEARAAGDRDASAGTPGDLPAANSSAAPPAAAPSPPDGEEWEAVRIDTRYVFPDDLEININGVTGRLVDLSTSGCQVLSPAPLTQNQMVKLQLPFDEISITCAGRVVWARAEAPAGGGSPGCRAGLRFTKLDQADIEAFVIRYSTPR